MLSIGQAQQLIDLILGKEWKLKIINSGGGLCVYKTKEIWIDSSHINMPFILHEITHAITKEDKKHSSIWADKYTELLELYLEYPNEFNEGVK